MCLPIFPSGVTHITSDLAFANQDGTITYFNGFMPVFSHAVEDTATFRMITAQFCVNGHVKQSEIARVFGIPVLSVKRSVKRYREYGTQGFFRPRPKRGASVLTEDVLAHAQQLLDEGDSISMVAQKLGLKNGTVQKAVTQKRLHRHANNVVPVDPTSLLSGVTTKSERSVRDSQALTGMATTNMMERVLASVGQAAEGVPTRFETSLDVPHGGLLFSLPALMVCGLLHSVATYFHYPVGYYRLEHIFLLLAFMALGRLRSVESFRYCSPGEWGKLLGIDRIPEVRTLREKIALLSSQGTVEQWSSQLCQEWMKADPLLHRFCLVFDREGYSPDFIARMRAMHIASLTYHKYPGSGWPAQEFVPQSVRLISGETVTMHLAERGVYLSKKVWVREIRKRTDGGHQTSILSTNFKTDCTILAATMFARWSQENFFNYMRQHYGLDRVIDYHTESIPDTTRVVNPDWRRLDGDVRSKTSQLSRHLAQFGALHLDAPIDSVSVKRFEQNKAQLHELINDLTQDIEKLKLQRKEINKHIQASQLPDSESITRLNKDSKQFIDTIKMIAYRAETAMVYSVREKLSRHDDARAMIRAVYNSEADIVPDKSQNILRVRLHHMANQCENEAVQYLCNELNATRTVFPGTDYQLLYELVSPNYPPDQDA
jgi:transposase-like protein